ncbi:hypothetical protein Hypma_014070 [Hypsizygus marmoreus]|uniref:Uncharacterized protein n=1 Tax=Hypsizygus marmoreus TaxID=39966 RepID=A0A369K9A4_HYPMA|nr:hypothetical protein Hypma_014070 [Hypsizygus marmoreus]
MKFKSMEYLCRCFWLPDAYLRIPITLKARRQRWLETENLTWPDHRFESSICGGRKSESKYWEIVKNDPCNSRYTSSSSKKASGWSTR